MRTTYQLYLRTCKCLDFGRWCSRSLHILMGTQVSHLAYSHHCFVMVWANPCSSGGGSWRHCLTELSRTRRLRLNCWLAEDSWLVPCCIGADMIELWFCPGSLLRSCERLYVVVLLYRAFSGFCWARVWIFGQEEAQALRSYLERLEWTSCQVGWYRWIRRSDWALRMFRFGVFWSLGLNHQAHLLDSLVLRR